MRTVPAFVADLAVSLDVCRADAVLPHGRLVGEAVEVDLESLENAGHGQAAAWMSETWKTCRDNVGRDQSVTGRRTLIEATQLDTKKARRDLREECEALVALPGYGPLLDALLGTDPDIDTLRDEIAHLGGELIVDGQTATVRFNVPHLPVWPAALGGQASPAEMSRELVAVIRWAKWRDRRSRRLAALHVVALESWPAPPAAD